MPLTSSRCSSSACRVRLTAITGVFESNSARCARSKSNGAQCTVRVVVEPRPAGLPGSLFRKSCPFIVRHGGDNHKARLGGHNDECQY